MSAVDPAPSVRRTLLVILALLTTALFFWMIWDFVKALVLSAILSGLFYPLYEKLQARLGGRSSLASAATLSLVVCGVVAPLSGFLIIVADQAVRLSRLLQPWFVRLSETRRSAIFDRLPPALRAYQDQIPQKIGEALSSMGTWAVEAVTQITGHTAHALVLLFVALYAMFFFLKDGRKVLDRALYYLPLPSEDEQRLVGRFVSVARATIKGTLIIGLIQGSLGGLAFWVVGIDGAALWAAAMSVLSVIPAIGHGLVWIPAVGYLALNAEWGRAIGLLIWCAGVVSSVDNFLRPWLVGKDTKLPDLLILISTLGGLSLFGAVGLILGPVVASLFVTVWDLYGAAFEELLPAVKQAPVVGHATDRGQDREA